MPYPMIEMLREDLECEELLSCFHGLGSLDRACFRVLTASDDALTVDEIAEEVDRERSTVYRSMKRLTEGGFVEKEQRNYEQGGYYHVYRAANPDEVADDLQRLLNDWYAEMGTLIGEFRDTYEARAEDEPEALAPEH